MPVQLSGTVSQIIHILRKNPDNLLFRVNRVDENIYRLEQNQGHRGHRKVKLELDQGLVTINLHMELNVLSSNPK